MGIGELLVVQESKKQVRDEATPIQAQDLMQVCVCVCSSLEVPIDARSGVTCSLQSLF